MSKLHYLTVQDILWINLQATKKVQHFSYARLEEATFYQYAYGDSNELLGQAARFLAGFVRMRPLEAGVEVTAFLATAAFLRINGACLQVEDAQAIDWFRNASASTEAARDALEKAIAVDPHPHHGLKPDIRMTVNGILAAFPRTTASLAGTIAAV